MRDLAQQLKNRVVPRSNTRSTARSTGMDGRAGDLAAMRDLARAHRDAHEAQWLSKQTERREITGGVRKRDELTHRRDGMVDLARTLNLHELYPSAWFAATRGEIDAVESAFRADVS